MGEILKDEERASALGYILGPVQMSLDCTHSLHLVIVYKH